MSARYTVKPKADRDLDDNADYLAREANLDIALTFLSASYETFALLADNPQMGWTSRMKNPALKSLRESFGTAGRDSGSPTSLVTS